MLIAVLMASCAALVHSAHVPAQPVTPIGVPLVDFAADAPRRVVVDREDGQYLGHVSTVLLRDGRTILAVYPKGHGKGALVLKRSPDGGKTWSERLAIPENWATSRECPSIHRVRDPASGAWRLILFSGLYPCRMASSEDEGETWTPLAPAGDWGGIVLMGSVDQAPDGGLLALFHDDGRFFGANGARTELLTLYQTRSADGGRRWEAPTPIYRDTGLHLCEPGLVRSPDGKRLAALLRENARRKNSHVMFSDDDGATWSTPRELPASLTGDRHVAKYAPDGRLFVSFRDTAAGSATNGDWIAWVGTWDDVAEGRAGQCRVRLMDNHKGRDCGYSGVEVLADGTIVATSYGHWDQGEEAYILSVRVTMAEVGAALKGDSK